MQANDTKNTSAHAETIKALVKPKVKPKIPKGSSCKLSRLAYITYPKLGKCACVVTAEDLRLCWSKSKAKVTTQTKSQAVDAAPSPAQAPAPKSAQAPAKAPE